MMVSTKGRYALRIMADLAENQEGGPVSLKDIAERENIGIKYLEIIVSSLNKNGKPLNTIITPYIFHF